MNNSKFAIESVSLQIEEPQINVDGFKEREQRLVRLIEALQDVQKTKGWSSLKKELLDELPASLEKQISVEAKKPNPDTLKLNRLAGELKWAERFSDLKKIEDVFRVELQQIRLQLYGTTEKDTH